MEPGQLKIGVTATGSVVSSSHPVSPDQFEKDPKTLVPREQQAAEHELELALSRHAAPWKGSEASSAWIRRTWAFRGAGDIHG